MTESMTPRPGIPEQGPFVDLDGVTLPGAGAYTAQAYVQLPPNMRRLHAIVTYAAVAASVNPQGAFRLQWRLEGVTDVYETAIDVTVTKSNPFIANGEFVSQLNGPIITALTSVTFQCFTVAVPIKATGVRLLAAELGDTAHPGVVTTRFYTSDKI